ncbi:MAG: bifunctional tetrahydrofolate synthase/dihydrofolate synthase [Mizugakiibacter sp.]|uniref:bifunctional tetrahydrofolate synthase/dihydrofolate synthase n=1 Tax=Mizugakiibacter sp. TaxID=1972610 RepID=UPI0031C36E3F|nr:bifunctional tetrahydrofolate synthase/dihydrofolate synthase [Xanthomonadaceae bacterium]
MTRTLEQWLDHQQRVHARGVDLGLERVRAVWERMGAPRLAPVAITVGGTNGKGSTVAFLEAMLAAAGKRVGAYTSPHLLRYNERVRIDGADADDAALVAAFERIEAARGEIPLTYFEYGTLAALDLFARAALDVALLEVGLGGRLDAVNIVDADAAIVTTIGLDHMDWLGADRDSIGREKAGIFRAGRPAVIGEADPPHGLLEAAARCGARVLRAGRDFDARLHAGGWRWTGWREDAGGDAAGWPPHADLPAPVLQAPSQIANAAAAISALYALRDRLGWDTRALAQGVAAARVRGRLEHLGGDPELVVDVAHNPQAATELAAWLDAHPPRGRVLAAYGALSDKDVAGVAAALGARIAHWHLGGLEAETPRGLPAPALAERFAAGLPAASFSLHADMAGALAAARAQAQPGDRILAFGSFYVAAAALRSAEAAAARPRARV